MVSRPEPNEYSAYYQRYIDMVPAQPLLQHLSDQKEETAAFLRSIPADKADFRYAEGKWSVKEVIGHICDTERVMAYRLLRASRGDRTPLAGFDENQFVAHANFSSRSINDLVQEYQAVRQATLALAASLSDEAWLRLGNANGNEVSARALGYIIAGHELHHLGVIRERYLG